MGHQEFSKKQIKELLDSERQAQQEAMKEALQLERTVRAHDMQELQATMSKQIHESVSRESRVRSTQLEEFLERLELDTFNSRFTEIISSQEQLTVSCEAWKQPFEELKIMTGGWKLSLEEAIEEALQLERTARANDFQEHHGTMSRQIHESVSGESCVRSTQLEELKEALQLERAARANDFQEHQGTMSRQIHESVSGESCVRSRQLEELKALHLEHTASEAWKQPFEELKIMIDGWKLSLEELEIVANGWKQPFDEMKTTVGKLIDESLHRVLYQKLSQGDLINLFSNRPLLPALRPSGDAPTAP